MKTNGSVGMGGEVVEELFTFVHCFLGALGLLARDCAEGYKDGKVNGTSIVEDASDHALNLLYFGLGKRGRCVGVNRTFGFAPVLLGLG